MAHIPEVCAAHRKGDLVRFVQQLLISVQRHGLHHRKGKIFFPEHKARVFEIFMLTCIETSSKAFDILGQSFAQIQGSISAIKKASVKDIPGCPQLRKETLDGVTTLVSFDVVRYAGQTVANDLETHLVAAGAKAFQRIRHYRGIYIPSVLLVVILILLQAGGLLNFDREMTTDKHWNWLCGKGLIPDYLAMDPRGDNTLKAAVKAGYPPKVTRGRIFSRGTASTRIGYKYIYGVWERTHIQLMLTTAIVLCAGKPQTGCLILPSDLSKGLSTAVIKNEVWPPVVEQANAQASTHSRLLLEMVEIFPDSTSRGTRAANVLGRAALEESILSVVVKKSPRRSKIHTLLFARTSTRDKPYRRTDIVLTKGEQKDEGVRASARSHVLADLELPSADIFWRRDFEGPHGQYAAQESDAAVWE
ncbi:hypothetical protein C8R46DRAFT_1037143 [Mycena filopes]|nr:hypothetical protein C8R46DRAFT_1037143 [Mycena filopes]